MAAPLTVPPKEGFPNAPPSNTLNQPSNLLAPPSDLENPYFVCSVKTAASQGILWSEMWPQLLCTKGGSVGQVPQIQSDGRATWTTIGGGGLSLAAVGAAPNANGATLTGSVLNLQPADASNPGVATAAKFTEWTSKVDPTRTINTTAPLTGGGDLSANRTIALGTVPVANGGTNSTTALVNNRVMQSAGGAIVEAAAITASRALKSDANGIPVASTATAASLDALSGTNSGDVTLTAVGAAPNANGATLSGQALTLQPSNGTNPGLMSAADFGKLALLGSTINNFYYTSGSNTRATSPLDLTSDAATLWSAVLYNTNATNTLSVLLPTGAALEAAVLGGVTLAIGLKWDCSICKTGVAGAVTLTFTTNTGLTLYGPGAAAAGIVSTSATLKFRRTAVNTYDVIIVDGAAAGGGGGVTTLAAVDAAGSANPAGATIVGSTLNLNACTAAEPGVMLPSNFSKLSFISSTATNFYPTKGSNTSAAAPYDLTAGNASFLWSGTAYNTNATTALSVLLPTGTVLEAAVPANVTLVNGTWWETSILKTGTAGNVTLTFTGNTGLTLYGPGAAAAGILSTSATLKFRRTAANTYDVIITDGAAAAAASVPTAPVLYNGSTATTNANTAATITAADLLSGSIRLTGTGAVTATFPTPTQIETAVAAINPSLANGTSFTVSIGTETSVTQIDMVYTGGTYGYPVNVLNTNGGTTSWIFRFTRTGLNTWPAWVTAETPTAWNPNNSIIRNSAVVLATSGANNITATQWVNNGIFQLTGTGAYTINLPNDGTLDALFSTVVNPRSLTTCSFDSWFYLNASVTSITFTVASTGTYGFISGTAIATSTTAGAVVHIKSFRTGVSTWFHGAVFSLAI